MTPGTRGVDAFVGALRDAVARVQAVCLPPSSARRLHRGTPSSLSTPASRGLALLFVSALLLGANVASWPAQP